MDKFVEVEITYCDKDIKQAVSYIINRTNTVWVVFPCVLTAIAGILLYCLLNGFSDYLIDLMLVIIFFTFLFYSVFYRLPVRRYMDFYRKRKGGTYTFTNQEVRILGKEVQSVCAWSIYKKGYDIPNAFLLTDANKFIYVFPKRCFKNDSDMELMRQLMSEKISGFKIYN